MFLLNFSCGYVWLWYNQTKKLFLLSTAVHVFYCSYVFPLFFTFFLKFFSMAGLWKCRRMTPPLLATFVVAYLFTHRNGNHEQLCVISLSYIFYLFQRCNLWEKCFFHRCFRRSERPLQKNFLHVKVEEDLKFLLS